MARVQDTRLDLQQIFRAQLSTNAGELGNLSLTFGVSCPAAFGTGVPRSPFSDHTIRHLDAAFDLQQGALASLASGLSSHHVSSTFPLLLVVAMAPWMPFAEFTVMFDVRVAVIVPHMTRLDFVEIAMALSASIL